MPNHDSTRRIVVVGACASGKSTLVAGLKERGYDAYICAQEHSAVPKLYLHQHPDVVVFLHVELEDVRRRRTPAWSKTIYDDQQFRLASARSAADIIVDTSASDEDATIKAVVSAITALREARVT